jgi:hypothetical protein
MFSTKGIKEAEEASLALRERNACIEAEREFNKRELEPRLIEWAAEMHDLWSKFVKGDEFLKLKESLKTMDCDRSTYMQDTSLLTLAIQKVRVRSFFMPIISVIEVSHNHFPLEIIFTIKQILLYCLRTLLIVCCQISIRHSK